MSENSTETYATWGIQITGLKHLITLDNVTLSNTLIKDMVNYVPLLHKSHGIYSNKHLINLILPLH